MFLILNKFSKLFVVAVFLRILLCGADLDKLQEYGLVFVKDGRFVHTPYDFKWRNGVSLGETTEMPVLQFSTELSPAMILPEIQIEWEKLRGYHIYGSHARKQEILSEYNACLSKILVNKDLTGHWAEHEIDQLTCYEISMLLGCANVYGADRDNSNQFYCSQKAYGLLVQLNKDVTNAYVDGTSMRLVFTKSSAEKIMRKAWGYMSEKEREGIVMDSGVFEIITSKM
jgi:hypothetical protein